MSRGCRIGEDWRQATHPSEELPAHIDQRACRIGVAPFRGGVVIHEASTGRLFQLNHTAARVLSALRNGDPEEVIVCDLARMYEADAAAVRHDLDMFVNALQRAGLLGPCEAVDGQGVVGTGPPRGAPALDAAYRVGEITVRVVCYPANVAAAFAPLAAPAMVSNETAVETRIALFCDRGAFVLTRDDCLVEKLGTAPAARWALVRQLVSAARRSPCLALLHAGAIVTPAGCLLICGESGAGKSTLLAGLIHAGFAFVADDIVPLEEGTGLVWPVRLAISIKQDSWRLVGSFFPGLARAPVVHFGGRTIRYLWPDSDALAIGTTGYRVAAVLFPRYAKDLPGMLSQLDPVRSLALLGEGGSVLPFTDSGLEEFLAWWSVLPAYQLSYGRLDEAIRDVSTLTDRLREGSDGAANAALAPSAFMAEA